MTSPITSLDALRNSGALKADGPVDPKALKAAKDFEAIFLRTLLSSLQKTTSMSGGTAKQNTGQSTYGSMVVGAMADSISGNGGIGLADIVAKSLSAHINAASAETKPPK